MALQKKTACQDCNGRMDVEAHLKMSEMAKVNSLIYWVTTSKMTVGRKKMSYFATFFQGQYFQSSVLPLKVPLLLSNSVTSAKNNNPGDFFGDSA